MVVQVMSHNDKGSVMCLSNDIYDPNQKLIVLGLHGMPGHLVMYPAGVVLKEELEKWPHQQKMEGLLAMLLMLQKPETAVVMAVQVMSHNDQAIVI